MYVTKMNCSRKGNDRYRQSNPGHIESLMSASRRGERGERMGFFAIFVPFRCDGTSGTWRNKNGRSRYNII